MRPTRAGLILNPNMDLDFITSELEKMGYEVRKKEKSSISKYLQAAVAFNDHATFTDGEGTSNRIMTENVDLFLALAGMTNETKGHYGEYWKFIKKNDRFTTGKLYKQIAPINTTGCFICDLGIPDSFSARDNVNYFQKATVEEIKEFFKENKLPIIQDSKELLRRILELNDSSK